MCLPVCLPLVATALAPLARAPAALFQPPHCVHSSLAGPTGQPSDCALQLRPPCRTAVRLCAAASPALQEIFWKRLQEMEAAGEEPGVSAWQRQARLAGGSALPASSTHAPSVGRPPLGPLTVGPCPPRWRRSSRRAMAAGTARPGPAAAPSLHNPPLLTPVRPSLSRSCWCTPGS